MPWLRNCMWALLYLFMIVLRWWIIKRPDGGGYFGIMHRYHFRPVSSRLIKENIFRLRLRNDPAFAEWSRVLVGTALKAAASPPRMLPIILPWPCLYTALLNAFQKWPACFLWAFSICYAGIWGCITRWMWLRRINWNTYGYLPALFFNRNHGLQ